jgi:hypothetical protein
MREPFGGLFRSPLLFAPFSRRYSMRRVSTILSVASAVFLTAVSFAMRSNPQLRSACWNAGVARISA